MKTQTRDRESTQVPWVETPRLWLRPWRMEDVTEYGHLVGDPEVMRYMGCGLRYRVKRTIASLVASVSDIQARMGIRKLIQHWQRFTFGEWAVEEKATGKLVGKIGLTYHQDWTADPAKVEIGWILARHVWGRGFATEGGRASLAYAFKTLKLERVVSICQCENVRSQRVMRHIGLSPVGMTHWKGCDVTWCAIDRSYWERCTCAEDSMGIFPELPKLRGQEDEIAEGNSYV